MFDINFYMNVTDIRKQLENGSIYSKSELYDIFENFRNKKPYIYNIETTNACNMNCEMCPRTTLMTRPVKTLDLDIAQHVISQLNPFDENLWQKWEQYLVKEYGINKNDMSENHFFLYIIPNVIQLHGYGDPLLHKDLHKTISALTNKGLKSYFSCNPSNIDMDRTILMLESGLDYIKYSVESTNDENFKSIRGKASNFTDSYKNICKLPELKKNKSYKTTFIITMLDLNKKNQKEEYKKLVDAFEGKDVYIYLKSEDQQWYRKDYHRTKSIHWSEFCKHPWMSMTIKSNADVAMCMEDFNNEIFLCDVKSEKLYDIWNGKKYTKFRWDHINSNPKIKCFKQCDMIKVGDYLK